MKIDHRFELEPVLYNNLPIKLLEISTTPNNTCFELHWHTRFEMLIIEQGSVDLSLNGKQFTAEEGDIVLINPETMHEGHTTNQSVKYRVIMFELDSFTYDKAAKNILESFQLGNSTFIHKIHDCEVVQISNQIFDAVQNKSQGFELKLIGLVYYMLSIFVNKYIDSSQSNPSCPKEFAEIIDYISQNFCKDITTSSISSMFGYNESYFCRRFKEITGLKPLNYIKILRLEKSKDLLKEHDSSIVSIAAECGFSDANYFARCFKSHYQLTPKEYRAQNI